MNGTISVDSCIAFANTLLDPTAVSDAKGRLLAVNPALENLLGYTEADNPALATLVPEHRRGEPERHLRTCLRGEKIVAVPTELQHREGRVLPVLLTLSPFHENAAADVLVIWTYKHSGDADRSLERLNLILENEVRSRERILDETIQALETEVRERRQIEDRLRLSQKRLRVLSQKTFELLESDRQLVAKELHDSIGASLAAIKFALEGWLDVYGERFPSPEIPFESIIGHIVETIKETKRISANLRPTTLDDLGLLATARWFCRNLAGLYNGLRITTHFDVSEDDIPEALKIVLYRVMQEALGNAAKHSGAEEIQVSIAMEEGQLEMAIADEGSGFDPRKLEETEGALSGFGIDSMRERVEICQGQFALRTRIGGGTRIRVRLPVASDGAMSCNVAAGSANG